MPVAIAATWTKAKGPSRRDKSHRRRPGRDPGEGGRPASDGAGGCPGRAGASAASTRNQSTETTTPWYALNRPADASGRRGAGHEGPAAGRESGREPRGTGMERRPGPLQRPSGISGQSSKLACGYSSVRGGCKLFVGLSGRHSQELPCRQRLVPPSSSLCFAKGAVRELRPVEQACGCSSVRGGCKLFVGLSGRHSQGLPCRQRLVPPSSSLCFAKGSRQGSLTSQASLRLLVLLQGHSSATPAGQDAAGTCGAHHPCRLCLEYQRWNATFQD